MKTFLIFTVLFLLSCVTEKEKQYKIVYNVGYDIEADNYEIFIMDMDGSNKKNISNWKGVDWTYYAREDKIFFISDRDTTHRMYFLYEMDINGENIKKVSDIRLADSWMSGRKNGAELIVKPHSSVDSMLYIINTTNGSIQKKINTSLPYNSDPCFSEDGQKIVFRGGLKKSKRDSGFIDELYLVNPDGSGLQQLTDYPKSDTTAEWYAYKAGPPIWNYDENFISYQSKQQGKYSLYAVTPDGSGHWKLTANTMQEGYHNWSSDGKWLAVELFDLEQTQFHIGLMNWQTKEMQVLTDTTYKYQQAPVFVEVKN